jgi:hypothetical protein
VTAPRDLGRAARAFGLVGVLGNVLGVAFLRDVPSPYRPGDVAAWLAGSHAHPAATHASAWTFTVGLAALAVFAVLLALAAAPRAARPGWVWGGALLAAAGALLNAAGTLAPAVAVSFVPAPPDPAGAAVGAALLALTLHLDAHFNLVLGLGLVAVNLGLGDGSGWPRWARVLGVVAGLASVPVALQASSDAFAKLLAISGPLWLAWILAASVRALWASGPEAAERPRAAA